MQNNLLIGDTKRLYQGYLYVCDAVAESLGGEGRYGLLENQNVNLVPTLTKDGISIAEVVRFKDKVLNFGALQAIAAAARTLQYSGDSTTTTLVFAQGFLRNIKKVKFNKTVERGIEKGFTEATNWIKELSKPVDRDLLIRIATTSANNDTELGLKIVEAYDKVGYDGIVEVRKDYGSNSTEVISQSGMKINKGYLSPFFINNQHKGVWEAEKVLIVSLEAWQSDENIMNFIKKNRRDVDGNLQPILFFMEKENGEFKEKLIELIQAEHLDACLVVAPDGHNELMCTTNIKDLALFTGGVSYHPKHREVICGYADSVIVDFDKTTIVIKELSEDVVNKIAELKTKEKQDDFTKERIQRLEGVSCLISVGGNSANDVNEIFDRVEDALSSVKSAVPEGYIVGGGSALLYISAKMQTRLENKDEQLGYNLVKTVLQEPAKRILVNANRKQGNWLFGRDYFSKSKKIYGVGYNAKSDSISNLLEDGIIDSAKSIRVALDSAKDSAVKMLLTNVIVTFPDYKQE
jgi:chaperonin GroEL